MTAILTPSPAPPTDAAGGAAAWSRLEWDSAQFGFPAARLERLEAAGAYWDARARQRLRLGRAVEECRQAGIRHLTARVDAGDAASIHALEESGFELIDGILTFHLGLNAVAPAPAGTRPFEPRDLEEVLEIGRTAYVFDRFHADAALAPGTAARVNETWTRNCCLGTAADAVLLALERDRVAAYAACRAGQPGVIILVAAAAWARGRGAARRASLAALAWLAGRGVRDAEVGTQIRNIPAARLYESLGFRLIRTSLTFRKLL